MAERLQRYLARAGVASRRHAEELITAGRVTVNNQLANTLGTKVEPNDLVALDGKLVMPPDQVSWYVLYKPTGVVTTLNDPQGRPTILGFLEGLATRVFPIGRLDWDAEGALLVTDDGAAAHRLLHPSFQVPRTYLAKVKGIPTEEGLARLVAGVRLEDGPARALEVERFQTTERNTWLRVTVGEGRPHLVKRLCAAIGHPVLRLFRPHQAGISVAGMQPGEIRPLRPEELALIDAVASGQPVPPMTLGLPPRRHGRAEDEEAEGEARPAASRGPAKGRSRPTDGETRASASGPASGRGPPSARPAGQRSLPHGRGSSPGARPGLPRGGAGGARAAVGGRPQRGGPTFGGKPAGSGWAGGRRGPPGAPGAFPRSGGEGAGAGGRPERSGRNFGGKPAGSGWAAGRRGPPGAPGAFPRASGGGAGPGGRPERGGRTFGGKPAGGGWAGGRRGPPGAPGAFPRAGGGGAGPGGRPERGGRTFGGKSASSGWAGGRRGPPWAPGAFPRGGGEGAGAGGRPERGGRHFGGKAAGGWTSTRRGRPTGDERGAAGTQGLARPPRGAAAGRNFSPRGPPRERPSEGRPWTGPKRGGDGRPPRFGPRAEAGSARPRPPQAGRRGPPRPQGGKPRGPRR
ncbi:MAG: pseudouridine synthase [Myxococcaceae bacterium]